MSHIDKETIDKILNRTDLVQVVKEQVPELKKRGINYQCCCPFHSESTPSFSVSPTKNLWKCFSCGKSGKGPISFLMEMGMTYVDAIKHLGDKANIEIKERELADEEKASYELRESARAHMKECQDFFEAEFDSPENVELKSYARKRWGDEFCRDFGIGVHPARRSALMEFAKSRQLNLDTLVACGMLSKAEDGSLKEPFYGRLMIPIRDNQGNVIAYTARKLESNKRCKYLNNKDTLLFKKGQILFAFDTARTEINKQNKAYIVEGAPDALRLRILGIDNVVAPLGTALTEYQLNQLKKLAKVVCFVPDIDPPKDGQEFGPGLTAVIKNAQKALEMGFYVFIKEIPQSFDEYGKPIKVDADNYCTTREKFDDLEEVEFPLWYAEKIYAGKDQMSPMQKDQTNKRMAAVLSLIPDKAYRATIQPFLLEYEKSEEVWNDTLKTVEEEDPKVVAEKERKAKAMMEMEYEFEEVGNCYYGVVKHGYKTRWSNFKMEPMYHIEDDTMPRRIYKITNSVGVWKIVELKQDELTSLGKFRQRVEGLGNFLWEAGDKELIKVKRYLYANTDSAILVAKMGWQTHGFFAYGNGILYNDEFKTPDDFGIIKLGEAGNFYLPSSSKMSEQKPGTFHFERSFIYEQKQEITLYQYFSKIVDVFGANGMIGVCFVIAAFFRDIVMGEVHSFPILNLYGPKSTGKTELARALVSFFRRNYQPPNLANSTISALNDTVSNCVNAVTHIDEYQNEIDRTRIEFLKGLWDGTGRSRMSMDPDKRQETTTVSAAVVLSGQQIPTVDNALLSRLCFVDFEKNNFSQEEVARYNDLKQVQDIGITHLGRAVLKHREHMEHFFPPIFKEENERMMKTLSDKGISVNERVRKNWVTLLATARCFSMKMNIPFPIDFLYERVFDRMIQQNKKLDGADEIARFWKVVGYLLADEKIFEGADIRIESAVKLTRKEEQRWPTPRKILKLNPDRIFEHYIMQTTRGSKEAALSPTTLSDYLEKTPQFLAKVKTRFDVFVGKIPKVEVTTYSCGAQSTRKVTKCSMALIFDYQAIVDKYEVDFETDNYDNME